MLTEEQWAEVKRQVSWTGGQAELLIDGYGITIERIRMSEMRDALMVYVNGQFIGKWLSEDCEERRRFFCPRTRYVHSAAQRKRLARGLGKRLVREIGADKKITQYLPWWPSFDSLRRHLVKHNTSIALFTRATEAA